MKRAGCVSWVASVLVCIAGCPPLPDAGELALEPPGPDPTAARTPAPPGEPEASDAAIEMPSGMLEEVPLAEADADPNEVPIPEPPPFDSNNPPPPPTFADPDQLGPSTLLTGSYLGEVQCQRVQELLSVTFQGDPNRLPVPDRPALVPEPLTLRFDAEEPTVVWIPQFVDGSNLVEVREVGERFSIQTELAGLPGVMTAEVQRLETSATVVEVEIALAFVYQSMVGEARIAGRGVLTQLIRGIDEAALFETHTVLDVVMSNTDLETVVREVVTCEATFD